MKITQELKNKINQIEYNTDKIDEYQIREIFSELVGENKLESDDALFAEVVAFDFLERDIQSSWGTYFGPTYVWKTETGGFEKPSIQQVSPEIINYWEIRAKNSNHPVLRARYAGLVWDFSKEVLKKKPEIDVAIIYINSLLEIEAKDLHKYTNSVIDKLERALEVALSINHKILIEKAKTVIIQYEKKNSVSNQAGTWGFAFDALVGNKKINLTILEEDEIIQSLENNLLVNSVNDNIDNIDPWSTERAAVRLAKYYKGKGATDEVKRVILQVGKSYETILEKGKGLQILAWLEHLHKLYLQFQLNVEAQNVLIKLRELGPKIDADLHPISFSFQLSKNEFDEYINWILDGDVLEDILVKIAFNFIPKKENSERIVRQLAKEHPFLFITQERLIGEKGRPISTIKSIDEDLESRIVRQISEHLTFSSIFLNTVFNKLNEKFDINESLIIEGFLLNSPLFQKTRTNILKKGINAYLKEDYIVSIHLLIPQIEEAIRLLVEICGGVVLKSKDGRGFLLKTFDDILRDEIVSKVLGEDSAIYFRILFTDQRGWNLRNLLCHGILDDNSFTKTIADRVLHAILCLGTVRNKTNL